MVRAILDGRKKKTRRTTGLDYINRNPDDYGPINVGVFSLKAGPEVFGAYDNSGEWGVKCPYGRPGDRLWVRETWAPLDDSGACFYRSGIPEYVASQPTGAWLDYPYDSVYAPKCPESIRWRPAIHMPRAASRILLEITGIRVERLQDISEEDAIAEGIEKNCIYNNGRRYVESPIHSFCTLWQSINGPESWDENPWVWVVEFKQILE